MVYQQIVGNTATSAASNTYGYTVIDLNFPASANAVLTKAFAYCSGAGSSNKIKIFRDDGTNYNFIGEASFIGSVGLNEIAMDLNIQSGDLIGYYCTTSSGAIDSDGGTGSEVDKIGDITSNSAKNTWTIYNGINKLNAGYEDTEHYVKVGGNDTLDGFSWTNAWATINKAAITVADGSTVHIGFGDYILEPAANKIAPQNVGTTGIYYLPETATTGGGTGTVSVEQNT